MAYLNPLVFDNGLSWAITNGLRLHVCPSEPATAALAVSTSLGNKATIALGVLGAGTPSGRKTTVPAITDGAGTANGTATHYAVINPTGPVLIATGALAASKVIANGDIFTLAAFDLTILAAT